jgi:hypothetical protein
MARSELYAFFGGSQAARFNGAAYQPEDEPRGHASIALPWVRTVENASDVQVTGRVSG